MITPECKWYMAERPPGLAPAAFSWWNCRSQRKYGIPTSRICGLCGGKIVVSERLDGKTYVTEQSTAADPVSGSG